MLIKTTLISECRTCFVACQFTLLTPCVTVETLRSYQQLLQMLLPSIQSNFIYTVSVTVNIVSTEPQSLTPKQARKIAF